MSGVFLCEHYKRSHEEIRAVFFDLQKDVQLAIDGNFIEESRCFFVLINSTCGNN